VLRRQPQILIVKNKSGLWRQLRLDGVREDGTYVQESKKEKQ
jgi:hypothetical protein